MNQSHRQSESHFSPAAAWLTLAFALLLGSVAVRGLWESETARSKLEKRQLASMPYSGRLVEDPAGYFRDVDAYLEDHFGFAVWLNESYRKLRFHVFRVSPQPNVALGRRGFVFLTAATEANPFSMIKQVCQGHAETSNLPVVRRQWQQVLKVDADAGRRAILAVPPTKNALYPELLPSSIPGAIRDACLAYPSGQALPFQLSKRNWDANLGYYYPYAEFRADRFNGNFYPKENFHFHGRSAHRFAAGLLEKLGIELPTAYSEQSGEKVVTADLAGPVGFDRRITIPEYAYSSFGIEIESKQPSWLATLMLKLTDVSEARTAAPITRRAAILLSDSFGRRLVRHLAPAYSHLVHINVSRLAPSQQALVLAEARRHVQPDDVIYLVNDIFLIWLGEKLHAAAAERTINN